MSLLSKQITFSQNVALLLQKIYASGYKCTLGEAYRPTEMAEIYAKEGKGIVDSQHTKKLAIDLNLFSPNNTYLDKAEDYKLFGDYWLTLSTENRWGGNFKMLYGKPFSDPFHFEMRG
jgi:hypothetical protein